MNWIMEKSFMYPNTPIEAVAETCSKLIKEGKILHWGMCEVNVDTIRRAHKICPVTAIQSEYHLMHRMVETNGVLELCEDLGIGFVPYSPLNRGFLGGMINEYTKFYVTNDNRLPTTGMAATAVSSSSISSAVKRMSQARRFSSR